MIGTTGTRRSLIVGLALAATAAGCGSYEVAYFAPEQGQGAFVTNGQRLAVAYRLAGGESAAQSFVALAIHQAYTAQASPGQRSTVVQVTVDLVNGSDQPAAFLAAEVRLQAGMQTFAPKWTYRSDTAEAASGAQAGMERVEVKDEVAPSSHARFDLFFDLGAYQAGAGAYSLGVPPAVGGIPLSDLAEFHVSWKVNWGGGEQSGKTRFTRGNGYRYGGLGQPYGPAWGWGWYYWPYPWPAGVYFGFRTGIHFGIGGRIGVHHPVRVRIGR